MLTSSALICGSPRKFAQILRAASCATAIFGISACAAAPKIFNPDALPEAQLSRIAQVCQNVMGLNPSEPLRSGFWLGGSHLERWSNHYRACITSLSDTVQKQADLGATRDADHECREKGYASASPKLALCVLQSSRRSSVSEGAQLITAFNGSGAQDLPKAGGSFFSASGKETRQREENACAALGLEPSRGTFGECVNDLQEVFHAIDTPID